VFFNLDRRPINCSEKINLKLLRRFEEIWSRVMTPPGLGEAQAIDWRCKPRAGLLGVYHTPVCGMRQILSVFTYDELNISSSALAALCDHLSQISQNHLTDTKISSFCLFVIILYSAT
jgi:hypothetical protein